MNRIYRLVFNRHLGVLQVASEVATGHAGATGTGAARLAAPLLPFALACALAAPAYASGVPSLSSATGATVSQNGATLQIDQNAAKAVLNWNSFNVGKDASVVFVQPSSSAVALNLIDASRGASVIDGSLRANGNVFLINSAGLLFGNHAQVNVGGLVASSLGLAGDDDNGYLLARGAHGAASVVNQGSIHAGNGGSVNLVGNHVDNRGSITADGGAIRLLSADQVKVTMDAAGAIGMQLVAAASQSVDGAAAVENSGSLRANGGQILLQAGSTGLSQLLVNNTGTLEATGVDTSGGSVRLVGSGGDVASSGRIDVSGSHGGSVQVLTDGAVHVDGRIDASGTAAGGSIRIGGGYQGGEQLQHASAATVASGATLDASATGQGNGGSIVVWSDGHTAVHGALRADAAGSGNGGLLETSGHTVDFSGIAVGAKAAGPGSAGTWLVDPEDLTVDSAAASTINSTLNGGTNVTLLTSLITASGPGTVSTGSGDINVNAALTWSGNSTLTLDAYHSIYLNAPVTATGASAGLVLNYGGYTENGSVGGTGDYYVNTPVSIGGAQASLAINGQAYRLIHSLADAAIYFNSPGSYALAQDIDLAGVTRSSALVSSFQSKLAGLGHSINNLTISGASGYVGLFGTTSSNSLVRDVHLGNVSISGGYYVGGLVGYGQGTIKNVTVDGSVTGTSGGVGGLAGYNLGLIDNGVFNGTVNGQSAVGGLVGNNVGATIRNSHSTGSVTGSSSNTGGLVGYNDGGTLTNTYSTGTVSGTSDVGGLVGTNQNAGTIKNSYASGSVIGTSSIVGGLVGMNYQSTIANTYATGSVTAPTSVGGLVGVNNPGGAAVTSASVSNSYATGAVSGTNNVGGLIGANTGSVSNASWDVGSTGQANAIGSAGGSVTNLTSFGSGNRYNHSSYGNLGTWSLLAGTSNVYVASDGVGSPAWIMIEGQTRPFLASEYSTTIANAHQLQLMAYNLAANYSLSADIDASQTAGSNASGMWSSAGFSPVGDSNSAFTGSLNGANHTISGLTIARGSASYVGLFGNTGTASRIGNLALTGATVVGTAYVGGVVGFNAGTLSGISVNGTMSGTGNFVGGLTGYNNAGTIAGVQTSGSVIGSGGPYSGNYVGGLIGSNTNGTIGASSSSSTVSGGSSVGGLVGNDYQGTYTGAFATGNVSSTSTTTGNNVGGLIGNAIQSTLQNVHATGNVTATTSSAGGLVGMAGAGTIQNAYASGNVSGTRSVGGLVGRSSATIATAYASGTVNGSSSEIGGLIGTLDHGSLASTHATGTVSGGSFVGGLVGYSDTGSVSASYATGAVSGTNYLGGLMGYNDGGAIGNAYATGNVSGSMYVAGLAGYNDNGTIANTYASGDATGTAYVGGLVGVNYNNTVRNSYATGNVSGTSAVGGLVGSNSNGNIVASFFATDIGGNPRNVGLNTVGNSGGSIDAISGGRSWSALNTLSTFTDAGWAIDDRGGTGLTWRLYEHMGTPLLRSFLTPLTITTAVSGLDKTYDGNGVSGTLASYTVGGAFDPSLLFGSSLRYATAGNGVGSYTTGNGMLQLGGLASSQQGYDIGYVVSGGIAITPATLTVTATSGSKTYGDTANLSGYSVAGLFGNDTVSGVALSSTGAGSGAAVGNYAINASGATGAGLSNYVVTYIDGSLRVDPATLRIVANDASKTYGGTATLNGYSVAGLRNGDTVSGVTLGSAGAGAGAAVGNYAITASGATGTGLSNYVVSYVDGSLRVDPATLRIVASDASKTYGSAATLSGYSVSGLLNGDTVSGVTLGSAGAGTGAAVGNYAITASGASGAGLSNYVVSYVDGSLRVDPATLRIVASDASKTVGSTATLTGYRVSGLLNGDTVSGVALDSAGAGSGAAVGNYAITASGASGAGLSNYAITYVDGLLNVVAGSGDGGGNGIQLPTTTVQTINTAVAAATVTSDAGSTTGTSPQKADETARELAAAARTGSSGKVTAATDSILIVDGGIRAPAVACSPGASDASADSCIIRQ
ncbi:MULTISPECIES: MBG domain-containing protein [Xanthomonas]|uniref:MBG domain-containing protein n=1 Tax=Xanthomonas TaxID=338 RepID=UPI001ADA6272|nr:MULTISPECIES: MBG domain-containing protein [unclassified Xanthomonas]MBO9873897.1 filamentous hemagglutinin N-terminal domain-containing protein [Xanthomonas sp. D-93]WNH43887.1 MBG domain-containing protein [Xanthomonas sp. A6251]